MAAQPEPAVAATLRELLQRAGPEPVYLSQGWIDAAAPPLHPEEGACVAQAVAARRAEFICGRLHAHLALRQAGIASGPLLPGAQRAPCWPAEVVGSITHDARWCAAAVAAGGTLRGLGIDVELVARMDLQLAAHIATAAERAALPADPAERQAALALLFSAKEAAFKAHFPHTGAWLDYTDAELDARAADDTRFALRLLKPAGGYPAGHRFEGHAARADERVCAVVLLRR